MGRRLGQHFLFDENILYKIAEAVGGDNEHILEIGAGSGPLTEFLVGHAANISAVEIDAKLFDKLKNRMRNVPNIELINQDILDLDFAAVAKGRISVIGNIPYYITTPIIEKIVKNRAIISKAVLLVQAEYAERLVAVPGTKNFSSITVFSNYFYKVRKLFPVPAESFSPPPKVNSAVVLFTPRGENAADVPDKFFDFVKKMFMYRRKKISNGLKHSGYKLSEKNEIFEKRIEQLSIAQIRELYYMVNTK